VNRYRITFTLLGLALAAIAIGAIVFAPNGRPSGAPETVESYAPADGATVLRQIKVEIDLPVEYQIIMVVDGITIPSSEVSEVPETGQFSWEPNDDSIILEWTPGFHTVWVRWDRRTGLPDPGEWIWTFRVQ